MKLHLSPRVTISSLPPQTEAVRYNDALVYYCSPHLYVASISTSKILHKSKYEDVQMLGVHGDLLYVCTSDIYILDPCSYELLDVIRLSKALINRVAFFGSSILVSKVSNKIVHISDRKAILEFPVASLCEGLLLNQFFYGYYDFERIVVFSGSGVKAYEMEIDEIISAAPLGNKIFVVDAHGTLTELVSGKSIELGLEPSLCHMSQSSIFTVSGDVVYEMDYTGAVIDRQVVSEMIGEYCGFVRDICGAKHTVAESVDQVKKLKIDGSAGVCDPSGDGQSDDRLNSEPSDCSLDNDGVSEDRSMDSMPDGLSDDHRPYQESSVDSSCLGSSGSGALGIASLGEGFVKTSENDFVFIKDKKVQKIISFVDDVTDSMEYKGNLILSTSSGLVKYTDLSQYSEGEYVFGSRIVRVSFDSITSAKISDGIVVTGSKDKSCQVFKLIPERTRLTFARIYEFRNFRAPITSLAFEKNVLAVASSDNILQIYRSEQQNMVRDSAEDCALYFSTFENVSTQHVHSKPITHVSITPMFIVTSSADRSSMVLDHNGTLVRTLHSDKILNSSCDHKYIAIGSHKAIKVYHNPSLAQLSVFQSKRPVLSGCFHSGYFLGVTDVLRVYDLSKKKCVKSYDLGLKIGRAHV